MDSAALDTIDLDFNEGMLTRSTQLTIQDGIVDAITITAVAEKQPQSPTQETPDVFEASMDAIRVFDSNNTAPNDSQKPLSKKQVLERINREEIDDEFDMVFEEDQQQKARQNDASQPQEHQQQRSTRKPKLSIQVDELARVSHQKIDVALDEDEKELEYTDEAPKITVAANHRRASVSALHKPSSPDAPERKRRMSARFTMEDPVTRVIEIESISDAVETDQQQQQQTDETSLIPPVSQIEVDFDAPLNDKTIEQPAVAVAASVTAPSSKLERYTAAPVATSGSTTPVAPAAAKEDPVDELEAAKKQWEEITKLREKQNLTQSYKIQEQSDPREINITHAQALEYFKSCDLSQQRTIVLETYRLPNYSSFMRNLLHFAQKSLLCYNVGTPVLKNEELRKEAEFVLCIAKISLDHNNDIHARMLFTVYKRLTGDAVNCPAIGSHWTIIGFQGNNPATDLRGAGMFALLQLLCFLQKGSRLPADIFLLSQHSVHHFPFCAVSINMTALSLEYLRKGKLTPLINENDSSTLDVVNDCYMSLFYRFYRSWRAGKTIIDFDSVKKSLENLTSRQIKTLIQEYQDALRELTSPMKSSQVFDPSAVHAATGSNKAPKNKDKGPSFTHMDV